MIVDDAMGRLEATMELAVARTMAPIKRALTREDEREGGGLDMVKFVVVVCKKQMCDRKRETCE